jgi:peroxiredoxin Q/BCP
MPAVVILDRRLSPHKVAYVHKGSSTFERPSIDDLLGELDDLRSDVGANAEAATEQ